MLCGQVILLCDDEPFIALDLCISVEEAGGRMIGPAASISEAMALLDEYPVQGAILDVHLVDGDVTPVAERLLESGVPFVVQSGVGLPLALGERIPPTATFIKPVLPKLLIEELARCMRHA